ncbi:MAG TPA: tRNA (guanosine(46)-N7)-methyltransferase TrmB [Steroidobacteraceae bacterium]|nr:tRNA (guanosine(46)-N7)-methyltransferase TrmB [Steroidobacteraceae bacterium]
MAEIEHPRSIRSFVMRGGRITEAQQRALELLWPKYGIPFEPAHLDLDAAFGRTAPVTLEIGFGNGDNLAAQATAHPERNFLGIEVHRPGVGRLMLSLEEHQLPNARVICHDAVEVLTHQVAPQTLAEVVILFPDPWPKKRHHKRRLVQAPFVELVTDRLCAGGVLHFASDWQPYADAVLELLNANPRLHNISPDERFVPRPTERNPTRFEKRGERLGHDVWDLAFERR